MGKGPAWLYLAITVVLFSTFELVSKTFLEDIHPLQINFLRFLLGGLFLLPFALRAARRQKLRLRPADLCHLALLGIGNIGFSMALLQLSLVYAHASTVAIIFSSNPIFVMLFAAALGEERLTRPKVLAIILGILGVTLISGPALDQPNSSLLGIALAVVSAIVYGISTVFGRKMTLRYGSPLTNALSFIFGASVFIPVLSLAGIAPFSFPLVYLSKLLYLGIFVSGLAYLTYYLGLAKIEAGKGSMVFFVKPVLASVLAAIFLHEPMPVSLFMGTVVIMAGLLLAK